MNNKNYLNFTFCLPFLASVASAQDDVWSDLARTRFDSAAMTLRVPCAVVVDEKGSSVPGLAPAYAFNLFLLSAEPGTEVFRLVDPIQAFEEIPDSCLDTLRIPTAGSTVIYTSSSTEVDADAAVFADKFYTLELQADLSAGGPVDFSVLSATSRNYTRPFYATDTTEAFPPLQPFNLAFIYDDTFIDFGLNSLNENLLVFEPGRLDFQCFYSDPDNLLEFVDVIGTNTRYRLSSSLSSADNGKTFTVDCSIFNRELNRLEDTIPVFRWFISF